MSYFEVMMFFAALPGILITAFFLRVLIKLSYPLLVVGYQNLLAVLNFFYGARITIGVGCLIALLVFGPFAYSRYNYHLHTKAMAKLCTDLAAENYIKKKQETANNSLSILGQPREFTSEAAKKFKDDVNRKQTEKLRNEPSRKGFIYGEPVDLGPISFGCGIPEYSFVKYLWQPS